MFVASIPDPCQLWQVLHTNSLARWVWSNFHICQSMLGATRTETQRQQVAVRERRSTRSWPSVCRLGPVPLG